MIGHIIHYKLPRWFLLFLRPGKSVYFYFDEYLNVHNLYIDQLSTQLQGTGSPLWTGFPSTSGQNSGTFGAAQRGTTVPANNKLARDSASKTL